MSRYSFLIAKTRWPCLGCANSSGSACSTIFISFRVTYLVNITQHFRRQVKSLTISLRKEIFNAFAYLLQILHDHHLFVWHKCFSSAFWWQRHISGGVHNQTDHAHTRASPYFGWCSRTETPNHSTHTQAHLPSSHRWRRLWLLGRHSYRLLIFLQVKSRP